MANNLYIPFHPGDYLADTAHLSAAEHGAYLLLILNYWQRGQPLQDDDRKLRGIARMTAEEWAASSYTILEFFTLRDGMLHHKRLDEELSRAVEKSCKATASAKRMHSKRSANAERTQSDCTAIQEQEQEQIETAAAVSCAAVAKPPFEIECRGLVGEEPVLLALDFHKLQTLVESGAVTEADVKDGIRSAMAKPDFRIRHWSQLEGWARGAAKTRMEGKSKQATNGYKSPVSADKRIWLPQGSEGYEAWRTAFPGTVKGILTSKGVEQGIYMPTEYPPRASVAA